MVTRDVVEREIGRGGSGTCRPWRLCDRWEGIRIGKLDRIVSQALNAVYSNISKQTL